MLYDKFYCNMLKQLECDITELCEEVCNDKNSTQEEHELADIILGMFVTAKEKMHESLEKYVQELKRKDE